MSEYLSVADAAGRLGTTRRRLSVLIYEREGLRSACPLIAARRLVPARLLPDLRRELERRAAKRESVAVG